MLQEIILRAVFLLTLLHFGLVNGQTYDVLQFGAKGDGFTDDSQVLLFYSMKVSDFYNFQIFFFNQNIIISCPTSENT